MPVIDDRGKPLPPGHPFERPLIAFGQKRPNSSGSDSAPSPAPADEDYEIDRLGITIPADDPMLDGIKAHEEYMKAWAERRRAERGASGPSVETANTSRDSGSSMQGSEKPLDPLELTLEVLETANDPALYVKQERLLRILATSGVLPAASTASATSDPMHPAIDAGESFLREMEEKRRTKRGTTDPSKPKQSQ